MNELLLTDTLEQWGRLPPETVTTQNTSRQGHWLVSHVLFSLFFISSRDELFLGQRFSFFFASLFSICCISPISELPTSPTRKLFQYTELRTVSGPQQGLWTLGTYLVSQWTNSTNAGGQSRSLKISPPGRPINDSHSARPRSAVQ